MLVKDMGYFANAQAVKEVGEYRDYGPDKIKRQRNVGGRTDGFTGTQGGYGLGSHGTRNPRNVVSPPPSPFPGHHFATFSPSLIEPLIRASCPERICTQCREPWAPVITRTSTQRQTVWNGAGRQNGCLAGGGHYGRTGGWDAQVTQVGLLPTCTCNAMWTPGVCLDPFTGSGTTLLVARELGRHALGLERSPAYVRLACERLGLADLAAWEGRNGQQPESTYADLPLFGGPP